MSSSDQMLYGDILEDDFGVDKTSPRTPLEDESFGDLFDDVLKGGGGSGGVKTDTGNHVKEEITEADIALLDAPDEKPSVIDTPVEPVQEVGVTTTKSASITWGLPTRPSTIYQEPMKKNSLFIGGLTWWTTDQDILAALRRAGYGTVRAIKMYENRGNGQFKGYAQVELDSEGEAIEAVEKIQEIEILGQKPVALYSMKTSPHQFELKCKGEGSGDLPSAAPPPHQPRSTPRPPPQSMPSNVNLPAPPMLPSAGAIRGPLLMDPANMGVSGMPGMGMPGGIPGMMPPNPMDPMGFLRPPLPMGGFPPIFPPGMGGFPRPPFADQGMLGGMRPAAPHVNPAFFLKNQWEGMGGGGMGSPVHHPVGVPDDEELADVMHRNQQVSTTAIQRAEESAAQGDVDGAADTLKMAINIIKQSSVARMDSTQVLIKSLQDCMASIEDDYSSSSHRSRSRHDDRDRERTSRHRDRSRERDGYRSSASSSRHRERDRSRERRRF